MRDMSWLAQKSGAETWKNNTEWKWINCEPALFDLDIFRILNCIS